MGKISVSHATLILCCRILVASRLRIHNYFPIIIYHLTDKLDYQLELPVRLEPYMKLDSAHYLCSFWTVLFPEP